MRHCEVSADSAARPWALLAAGFSHARLLPLLRSLAVLTWLGPTAAARLGAAGFVLLFVAGE